MLQILGADILIFRKRHHSFFQSLMDPTDWSLPLEEDTMVRVASHIAYYDLVERPKPS